MLCYTVQTWCEKVLHGIVLTIDMVEDRRVKTTLVVEIRSGRCNDACGGAATVGAVYSYGVVCS